ncbi:50S ribosomal protein L24 [Helicobacter cynogastricus]|uniref:50S ribosomal protein L24 n=1 Tax=Helicobacter cynogastricus TaxID=329937 RepID=UPI000CF0522A|nr:50S ribosomal protein L24 [Helicobacter cynogastricus]
MKCKIKKDDLVRIITGDDKGKVGKVLAVFPKKSTLLVEGCKLAKKALKPNPNEENPQSGHIFKEMPIHISNVKKEKE